MLTFYAEAHGGAVVDPIERPERIEMVRAAAFQTERPAEHNHGDHSLAGNHSFVEAERRCAGGSGAANHPRMEAIGGIAVDYGDGR